MIKEIVNLNTEFQAMQVKEILESNNILFILRSFHDSAYDGLFQYQMGWGAIEADEKDEEIILDLLKDII
jgi:hypothetical protein